MRLGQAEPAVAFKVTFRVQLRNANHNGGTGGCRIENRKVTTQFPKLSSLFLQLLLIMSSPSVRRPSADPGGGFANQAALELLLTLLHLMQVLD